MSNSLTIEQKLQAPFPAADIEWRAQQAGVNNGKPWALVLAYVTNRAIQSRLDDVFGAGGWQNVIREWRDKSTICGISVKQGDEWITKWDGAAETDIEATKGGISDAMKRAAVQWGIGRYLYKLDVTFAECTTERQRTPDWHQAKAKDGTYFYWKTPNLPAWALPKGEASKRESKPEAKQETNPDPRASGRVDAMIAYMKTLNVPVEDLEAAVGKPAAQFENKDVDDIRKAAMLMKDHKEWDFADAFASIPEE
jgi:hypothetical protein